MKARVLITEVCNRHCEGCCNRQWDLGELDEFHPFSMAEDYEMIIITGGEPMLYPDSVIDLARNLRGECGYRGKIIMYTAKVDKILDTLAVLRWLDGITLTLHEPKDLEMFLDLNRILKNMYLDMQYKSLRLNIFEKVNVPDFIPELFPQWQIKNNMKWIENCPLPEDEVFLRLRGI